ncbi:sodium-coupled monocarboxylate transporter 2-like isoform X1 [Dermacentor andersoni]|uniref:sodium-coupled monocarboxylate transporter 2-like isoform X1 n=1 Tax=Dermacentor andersoni TaxID=34620 RepID=UPI003B3BE3AB
MAAPHVLDYVLYALLMALGVAQGLYVSCRKRRGHDVSREAFLGDRSLGVLPLAVSVLVSTASPLGLVALTAHFYAYGLHLVWNVLITVSAVPLVVYCVVPVFYRLGVTSIFEYIRMRYNAFISLTACVIYLILTQSVGAALIFSAALTTHTIFGIPVTAASIMFGLMGTYYAAVAGLRGVVWTDCLQALITLLAPLVVIGKVVYDSTVGTVTLRPLDDIEVDKYILDVSMDLTKEENVWSCLVGGLASFLYRLGFDQMVLQRYLASRNLSAAQRTAIVGVCFSGLYYLVLMAGAAALIYRFRDCDPMLSKSTSTLDQVLPFYVKKELAPVLGFSGIFLAGVVSSSTSAVSSIINSQAAVLYVDVVAQYFPVNETWASRITKALAFASGIVMTAYSLAVPFIGSTMRIFILINSAVTGPFVGLLVLAILFPFANSKVGRRFHALPSFILLEQFLQRHRDHRCRSRYQPPHRWTENCRYARALGRQHNPYCVEKNNTPPWQPEQRADTQCAGVHGQKIFQSRRSFQVGCRQGRTRAINERNASVNKLTLLYCDRHTRHNKFERALVPGPLHVPLLPQCCSFFVRGRSLCARGFRGMLSGLHRILHYSVVGFLQ